MRLTPLLPLRIQTLGLGSILICAIRNSRLPVVDFVGPRFSSEDALGLLLGVSVGIQTAYPHGRYPMSELAAALTSRVWSPSAQRMRVLLFSLRCFLDFSDLQAISGIDPIRTFVTGSFSATKSRNLSHLINHPGLVNASASKLGYGGSIL
jgi:hypothetical protein